jgi:hypothetical protein
MDHAKIEVAQEYDQFVATKPLYIRKQSSQISIAQNQQLKDKNPYKEYSSNPVYPPRTSSIGMPHSSNGFLAIHGRPEDELTAPHSTPSEWTDEYVPASPPDDTRSTGSTVSNIKDLYITSPSSEIMGNFVPISKSKHSVDDGDA